jgi:hypothetical protein
MEERKHWPALANGFTGKGWMLVFAILIDLALSAKPLSRGLGGKLGN